MTTPSPNIVGDAGNLGSNYNLNADIATASNIRYGKNPDYTKENFLQTFPQFKDKLPEVVIDIFIQMANATVQKARYHSSWEYMMALFIAHFATAYLETTIGYKEGVPTPTGTIIAAAQSRGILTSSSVGDVSESFDFNAIGNDLDGWAAWKLTAYGVQYATLAQTYTKGGMLVW